MTYNVPKFYDYKTFDFSLSGGYVSNQNVTTYEASTLSGSVVFTERPNRANTLIYSITYRYVYVNPNSLQVSAELIPLLSQPTRVSGPGITWVHDTRNNPLGRDQRVVSFGAAIFRLGRICVAGKFQSRGCYGGELLSAEQGELDSGAQHAHRF